jgi:hypothetical protein
MDNEVKTAGTESLFQDGDRVRVTDSCVWADRRGDLGTVVRVDAEGGYISVFVALDAEPPKKGNLGTAFFEETSLEKVND